MPGKPRPGQTGKQKNQFISDRLDAFENLISESGELLSSQVYKNFLDKLSLADGIITNSDDNLRKVGLIDKAFKLFNGSQGIRILTTFANDLSDIISLGKEYYIQVAGNQAKESDIEQIINRQLGINPDGSVRDGGYLSNLVSDPSMQAELKQIVFQQVARGQVGYQDLKNTIAGFIEGTGGNPGALYQHYERFAFDTYSQVDRLNSKLHSEKLGLKYFFYNGGTVKDSRVFCVKNHGKVFTTEQAEEWKKQVNAFEMVPGVRKPLIKVITGPIIEKDKVQDYDPIIHMGGIKCRHSADFISEEVAKHYLKKQAEAEKPVEPVDLLMNQAKAAGAEIDKVGQELAEKYGGSVTPLNYKSRKRIIEKANQEYNGDVTQVKDAVRNTIVVDKSKLQDVIAELRQNPSAVRIKEQKAETDPLGYSGFIVNYKGKNGVIMEIQVNSPEMIYAKTDNVTRLKEIIGEEVFEKIKKATGLPHGHGHEIYEEYRTLDNTPANVEKRMLLIEESKKYYEALRQWDSKSIEKLIEKTKVSDSYRFDFRHTREKLLEHKSQLINDPDYHIKFSTDVRDFPKFGLSDDEANVILAYTNESFLKLNSELYKGEAGEPTKAFEEALNMALDRVPAVKAGPITRIVTHFPGFDDVKATYLNSIGKNITFDGFASFTTKEKQADVGIRFIVSEPKSPRDLRRLTMWHGEEEVLYKSKSTFKILKVEPHERFGGITVYLEEVLALFD